MSNEMNSDYCYIARTTKPIERFSNAGTIVAIIVDAPMFARQTAKDVAGYMCRYHICCNCPIRAGDHCGVCNSNPQAIMKVLEDYFDKRSRDA